MVNGNILLDEDGLNIQNVKDCEKRAAVGNFCEMIGEATTEGDTLHYVYDSPCSIYSILYNPEDPHCKLIGQRLFNQLQVTFGNIPNAIQSSEEFETKSDPRTHGGYKYENCPSSNYVYDKKTIIDWHNEWYIEHPEAIDWEKTNGIMPRRDRIIEILRQELVDCQNRIPSDGTNNLGLPHPKFLKLKDTNWEETNDDEIVSGHNDIIIKHQGEKIKAYSEKIGSLICTENYYHCEKELSDLEKNHGNKKVSIIYSIKKDGKYQFLSIDTAHGKFELCDDNGVHQREIRFDGSSNGDDTQDDGHSLLCVTEWKQKCNKK